jgi:hypothetical protein
MPSCHYIGAICLGGVLAADPENVAQRQASFVSVAFGEGIALTKAF